MKYLESIVGALVSGYLFLYLSKRLGLEPSGYYLAMGAVLGLFFPYADLIVRKGKGLFRAHQR